MSESHQKIACLGGLYSNYLALEVALHDIRSRGVDQIYCLGDMGAFGPFPDRVFPLLQEFNVTCIQGNYDDSIGNALDDCQCGYTDPRDNYFAQISYDYTLQNTSLKNRNFLRDLPKQLRIKLGELDVLLCHGSPRKVNEFLWQSTTSDAFLQRMLRENQCDVVVATHTGIKWHRQLNQQHFVNVGVLGRPENDGNTNVWYTLLEANSTQLNVKFVPVAYDYQRLSREMLAEKLPEEFSKTITTGWWTTCLEVLPQKERVQGVY